MLTFVLSCSKLLVDKNTEMETIGFDLEHAGKSVMTGSTADSQRLCSRILALAVISMGILPG